MTTFHASKFPVLIIGGTGKTGRRVAERLTAQGVPVRIGSRSASPAFDWENPESWATALEGVSAAYITYYPDLAVPGSADAIGNLARLAVRKGVTRLVLLSGRGEPEAQRAEQALRASGADWTIVRASWFMQNFSENMLLGPILAGEMALPVSSVREPFIHADDIADVVIAALTDDRHVGQLYEVTGPRMLTFAEATGEIAKASGRTIDYRTITPEEFMHGLEQEQVPADIAALVNELFTVVLDGRNEYLTDGVQKALGRKPRDFADYARETAATGIWEGAK
ncbi:NAD(P)H-binding protein [Phyllobacterium zundukense]|uniref:NmrA family transcriptional regulator n=1 Tax=Phyllobacterium zundukense TaxID=1867719 RepID=A0A2N9W4G2_9HYPH|nr:NAD(P)H-binding protein [Phyllobacterium zundukense]ATU91901.1 NmrA family transcriptional regulator [Phyllobacterium zundukense]PIO46630.1 NmrA family transcriptional regulator [Phyllobacterium zundukense]